MKNAPHDLIKTDYVGTLGLTLKQKYGLEWIRGCLTAFNDVGKGVGARRARKRFLRLSDHLHNTCQRQAKA